MLTLSSHDVSESEIIGHTDAITDEQVNRGLNDTNLEPVGLKQSEKVSSLRTCAISYIKSVYTYMYTVHTYMCVCVIVSKVLYVLY